MVGAESVALFSHVKLGGRAQASLLMSYAPQVKLERVNGVAPSSRPWHGRILLLNHTRFRYGLRGLVSPAGLSPAT